MAIVEARTTSSLETTVSDRFALEVAAGLTGHPKRLPSRYFYDERGSQLFQQITQLDDYYLTRCELEILRERATEMFRGFGPEPIRLVEFGAGDGSKTESLVNYFLKRGQTVTYTPIDICREILDELSQRFGQRYIHQAFEAEPIAGEYIDALEHIASCGGPRNLGLFLGSSIGNFEPGEAIEFLSRVSRALSPGDLMLIGFDLTKDPQILQRAYDDSAGLTREFNYNLLERINRELGGDFDRQKFVHHCHYNAARRRMESWLISTQAQTVSVAAIQRNFRFGAWEGIHVECSYKYDTQEIEHFASAAGFSVVRHLFDSKRYF
ncbi:MAG: L-histidine N(alpha)-methyltransferase, partial [Pirellulaceae bacterium]